MTLATELFTTRMLPYLTKGDTIAIVCTARKIPEEKGVLAVEIFTRWGLRVKIGAHIYSEYHQFAGTDAERIQDFQKMLDDPEVKAIICARGGYGTVRLLDFLDFSKFAKNPKWIIGYSDVTVLHSHIHQLLGIETLHSAMPVDYLPENIHSPAVSTLQKALFGEPLSYCFENNKWNREGNAEGILVGGNLSILYSLRGTVSDLETEGKILFLEDVDEYLYHIDRMMMNLKRGGKLSCLKALLIGGMTDMHDNAIPFGKSAEEIILDSVKEYDYPVYFSVPAGHLGENNHTLLFGRKVQIHTEKNQVLLRF